MEWIKCKVAVEVEGTELSKLGIKEEDSGDWEPICIRKSDVSAYRTDDCWEGKERTQVHFKSGFHCMLDLNMAEFEKLMES